MRCEIAYRQNGLITRAEFDACFAGEGLKAEVVFEASHLRAVLHAERETELIYFSVTLGCTFPDDCRLLLNGYQSWTDTAELQKSDRQHSLDFVPRFVKNAFVLERYGDYAFARYSRKKGVFHGFSYAYVRRGAHFDLTASLSEETGFTQIVYDTIKSQLVLIKDCEGLCFMGDYEILDVLRAEGDENAVFDRYFSELGIDKPKALPVSGYTSWYNHYQNISQSVLEKALEGIVKSPFKADIFQIDDGYQRAIGDWLEPDTEKFPNGLKPLSAAIHDGGMKAGLWLAPFACTENSHVYTLHPDWLLRDAKGSPVKAGHNWDGFYVLDFYHPDFRAHLKNVIETMLTDWGFDLLKLDFLYACCVLPQNGKTRGQIMAEAMDFIRACAGDKLLLGCGVPLQSAFGKVDYCRVGCDVSLNWDDKRYMRLLHRERISTKNCIANTVFRRQLSGRAFLNDPDVFLLRDENLALTAQQKALLCRINHLFGGLRFTSDDTAGYDEKEAGQLRACLGLSNAQVRDVSCKGNVVNITYVIDGEEKSLVYDARRGRLL